MHAAFRRQTTDGRPMTYSSHSLKIIDFSKDIQFCSRFTTIQR